MPGIVEIRNYHLKPGSGERFGRIMQEQSLPLLRQAETAVVAASVSLHATDCYVLIRRYRDLEHLAETQHAFYSSEAWLCGPSKAIMDCIDRYITVVVPADMLLGVEGRGHYEPR